MLDQALSSYTPTIRTLSYVRSRSTTDSTPLSTTVRAPGNAGPRGSLVVAMPETPGPQRPLGNAARESELLSRLLDPVLVLQSGTPDPPTNARVLEELAGTDVVHFACHAEVDPADPSRSGLLLQDPRAPLTVSMLSAVNLDSVRLAFLSACGTALNPAGHLLEESVHLASALQLAGFAHVIGTLWEIEDLAAYAVAESFYTGILDPSGDSDPARAAEVLHQVSLALREAEPESVWIWAAHVHAGA